MHFAHFLLILHRKLAKKRIDHPFKSNENKTTNDMKHLKFNTFLLTLLLSMAGITAAAHDIEAENEDGVTIYYVWTNDKTALSVSYQGSSYNYSNEYSGNVVIPESIIYNGTSYPVTGIGASAFYECSGLTSVTIPNSVTSIGEGAFLACI